MSLPKKIPVKISSENAGYVSMTPVARRELSPAELIETVLALTGKNPARIGEILARGTVVAGASRYRWPPSEVDPAEIESLLARFPDPRPERVFDPNMCVAAMLRASRGGVELTREAGSARRLFKGKDFWSVLMERAAQAAAGYQRYSYSRRADVYLARFSPETARHLEESLALLKYSGLEQQLIRLGIEAAELIVEREPSD